MKLRRAWLMSALLAVVASATLVAAPVAAAAKPIATIKPIATTTTTAPASPAVPHQATAPQVPATASWTTYHYNNARSGYDPTEPSFSALGGGWTNTTLIGDIYAEPLVYGSTVYVATEDNYIYALDYLTGGVLWSKHLSTPMDASGLPCGNISPHVGITSTPVIDTSLNRIYAVGMVSTAHYVLWGVDLSTHALVVNHVVDPANADVTLAQGQRGALALSQGLIYIPYGGRAGDCFSPGGHTYYGIVLAARRTDGAVLYRFQTNGTGSVWASGGESLDSAGHVYVAIGNGTSPDSERVFKLNPNLSRQNSWVPADQASLDSSDADVGSIIPQLVGGGDVFQNGKTGDGYLLSSTAKQQQGPTHVCTGASSDASFGAAAYLAPYIYVPCSTGLFALKQTGNTFAPAWNFPSINAAPPIVVGGNVIVLDSSGSTLYVLNALTGAEVTSATTGNLTHFGTPATGNGWLFIPGQGEIDAVRLLGCTSANMTPDVASPQLPGATVTFTATSTGCNTTPEYKFFLEAPGGSFTGKTSFGPATWAWDTTGLAPGVYGVGVWVRATGSASRYESYWLGTYTLTSPACTSVFAGPIALQPVAPGSSVPWTGTATGCTSAQFRWWLMAPGSSTWVVQQAYGTSPWIWNTTGLVAGIYQIGVWARQAGSTKAYETYTYTTLVLGSGNCTVATVGVGAASPTQPGPTVTVTGTSNSCTIPQYQFLLLPPGGVWTVKRAFSAVNGWQWATAGYPAGVYEVGVWVKGAGSIKKYDAYSVTTFELKIAYCTSASIAVSPASPSAPGTQLTFTARSTGCTTPAYQFRRLRPPSTTWKIVQDMIVGGNTYTFDSTGASGPIYFEVVARQNVSKATYDTYALLTYWVGS